MIALIIFLIFVFAVLGIGALGAWSDIKTLTIPNMYSALILSAFPICYGLMLVLGVSTTEGVFVPLWSHLSAAAIVLVISAALFFFGVMGAADSKLATAYALWIGLGNLPVFLFMMSLFGAFLGAVALFIKKKKPFKEPVDGSWVAQLQAGGSKVPYGVPIVLGAAFGFYHVGFLNFEALASAFGI